MGIVLYSHPGSAPSRMVLLFAKHIGLELDVKLVDLIGGEQLKPEFLALNPYHTVPILVDNGFIVLESRAILYYLQEKYGNEKKLGRNLLPRDIQKRALIDMRINFEATMLYPHFANTYYPVMFRVQRLDESKVKKVDEMLGYVEQFLNEGNLFIAGNELTIADFSMAAALSTIKSVHGLEHFPRVNSYLDRCKGTMKGWEELNEKGCEEFAMWYRVGLEKLNNGKSSLRKDEQDLMLNWVGTYF